MSFDDSQLWDVTITNHGFSKYSEPYTQSTVLPGETKEIRLSGTGLVNQIQLNAEQINSLKKAEIIVVTKDRVDSNYDLPVASTTELGGIKIGNNLTISPDGKLSSSGGGGGGITVVEYDATDPANYVVQQLTLADFSVVDNSAIIDAANKQFKANNESIDVNIQAPYNQQSQISAIKLGIVPTSGTLVLDYSHYEDYSVAIVFKEPNTQLNSIVEQYLHAYVNSQINQVNKDFGLILNEYNSEHSDCYLTKKFSALVYGYQQRTAAQDSVDILSLENKVITFSFQTILDMYLSSFGFNTLEELIAYLQSNGMNDDETAIILRNAQFQNILLANDVTGESEPLFTHIPDTASEMYLILTPKYDQNYIEDRQPQYIDTDWTVDAELNASVIQGWIIPENIADGTYLKINGICRLLGHTCATGDFLQVYDNATKAILIKG